MEFPNWLTLELRMKKEKLVSSIHHVVEPVRRRLIEHPLVQSCSYSPFPSQKSVYLSEEPRGDIVELLTFMNGIGNESAWAEWVSRGVAERYSAIPTAMMGGPEFLPLINQVAHFHSDASLALYFGFQGLQPKGILQFALASSLIVVRSIPLTTSEIQKVFSADLRLLHDITGFPMEGLDWESTQTSIDEKYKPLEVCFSGYKIQWDRLKEVMTDDSVTALEQFEASLKEFTAQISREDFSKWQGELYENVARRLVHLIWLRLLVDNQVEMINMGWLVRLHN